VVQEGGIIHEDAMWDANEMALDGASTESIMERLKQEGAKPYLPKGGWEFPARPVDVANRGRSSGNKALEQAGRTDLIGGGCDCLIPAQPPKEALAARRERANAAAHGDHYHTVANPTKGKPVGEHGLPNQGYRPGRKTARRQDKKRKQKGGES
jgi:hypothetical protein